MSSRLALAMSATALVVAVLGSTPLGHAIVSNVPRNSVGPPQLKRNAVGPQKIAPNAVRAGHVLNGSLLVEDFKAGQIPAGPPGPAGPAGPAGVTLREVVTAKTANSSNASKQISAVCPAGKQVIGGGGQLSGAVGAVIALSIPVGQSSWSVFAYELVPTVNAWAVTSYAICVKAS